MALALNQLRVNLMCETKKRIILVWFSIIIEILRISLIPSRSVEVFEWNRLNFLYGLDGVIYRLIHIANLLEES